MADEVVPEVPMEVVEPNQVKDAVEDSENGCSKRAREGNEGAEDNEQKRVKVEDEKPAVEERRIESSGEGEEKTEEQKKGEIEDGEEPFRVPIGPKTFESSVEMFDYFFKLLHSWTPNINLNKYEHKVLLELLKKGHSEAERKIGAGIKHFQVRFHPQFKSRCFFLIREDDTTDDFSFRKCVDHILPLPENMQVKHDVNKGLRGKGGGRGHGRSRGRSGK